MANNELSGPALITKVAEYIKTLKNREFTYRLVILPETIGSICYINKFKTNLKKNIISGFNLSCVGDTRQYSYIPSKYGNTLADIALKSALIGKQNVKYYSFLKEEVMKDSIVHKELIFLFVVFQELNMENIKNIIQVQIT